MPLRGRLSALARGFGIATGIASAVTGVAAFGQVPSSVHLSWAQRLGVQGVHCRALGSPGQITLASSIRARHFPTTVLVHGLDSSKETWTGLLADLNRAGFPALALDLRGHGESPMGNLEDFWPETLANDIIDAIKAQALGPVVLVGHSMGGRVAMHVADLAKDAGILAAVVIEDMDIRTRPDNEPADDELGEGMRQSLQRFAAEDGRLFTSWEACRDALLPWYGHDEKRVNSWKDTRVRQVGQGCWWTDINPQAQRLARSRILASPCSSEAWDRLADAKPPFPIHVWVADSPGTVCSSQGPGSIEDMANRFPAAKTRTFRDSAHSIHNTARAEFTEALIDVIRSAGVE